MNVWPIIAPDHPRLERNRKRVAAVVLAIAKAVDNTADLLHGLDRMFGDLEQIGRGASRTVYALPYSLVLKVNRRRIYYRVDQNKCEYHTAIAHPDFAPKIYAWYRCTKWHGFHAPHEDIQGINLIVAERAEQYKGDVKRESDKWRLEGLFVDVHVNNLGVINGRVVLVDMGCGHFNDEHHDYATCDED